LTDFTAITLVRPGGGRSGELRASLLSVLKAGCDTDSEQPVEERNEFFEGVLR
jgi:hypothetical protein